MPGTVLLSMIILSFIKINNITRISMDYGLYLITFVATTNDQKYFCVIYEEKPEKVIF